MTISAHQIIEVPCPTGRPALDAVFTKMHSASSSTELEQGKTRELIETCFTYLEPKGIYKVFNPATCTLPPSYTEPGIKIVGTLMVLKGQTVYKKLSTAKHCVVLGASVGDRSAVDSLSEAVARTPEAKTILDTTLAAIAEYTAEYTNAAIVKQAMDSDLSVDDFLMPGTADFPIEHNDLFHFYIQAERRLGIKLEDRSQPLKPWEIMGVVGMFDKSGKGRKRACGRCKFREFCSIRAIGMNCHGKKGSFKAV